MLFFLIFSFVRATSEDEVFDICPKNSIPIIGEAQSELLIIGEAGCLTCLIGPAPLIAQCSRDLTPDARLSHAQREITKIQRGL